MDTLETCIVCGNEQIVRTVRFPLGSIPIGLCEWHKHHIVGYKFGPQAFENGECVIFPPCLLFCPDC